MNTPTNNMQMAVLEVSVKGFSSGTIVHVGSKSKDHNEWGVRMPDGTIRHMAQENVRLCW